ncbi:DUF802 domain-containing protein [Xenophilus aerolatus]|nr:DUF802 domain-containing protein [Xenophilus aerolatus]
MPRFLSPLAFLAGLAVIAWVGAGYLGSHLLALGVTLVIAAFYAMGALELHRFRQATATLVQAVAALGTPPASLAAWLETLHPSLRPAVRLRIEGQRVALPGPSMTPYLAGLLVLLGMLGTFLGMVVTLNGTGAALAGTTDLQAMRSALSQPVQGLGLAFGTSVAGVAASAMLGLVSALYRRERAQAALALDTHIATTLRPFSAAHQREQGFRLMEQQAAAMPQIVERLQTLMERMEQQHEALAQRLAAGQTEFHAQAAGAYTALAESVDRSLTRSLTDSAKTAAAAIQPVVEATMAQIARETGALHDTLGQSVQRQLDGLTIGFERTTAGVAQTWQGALDIHQRSSQALAAELRDMLAGVAEGFEQRSAALVDGVAQRLDGTAERLSQAWGGALDQQRETGEALALHTREALGRAADSFERQAAALVRSVDGAAVGHRTAVDAVAEQFGQRSEALVEGVAARLDGIATQLSQRWGEALDAQRAAGEQLAARNEQALAAAAGGFGEQAAALLQTVDRAHDELQATLAARDVQRLDAWAQSLAQLADGLKASWQEAGAQTARQQAEICDTLARTARDISAQTEAHAQGTIAEIGRLVETAAQAPRAAAEVIAELRQKLSDSMVRDNAMLEERTRILDTLATLLDAVNHASTEQRAAIDALVGASSEVLQRAGDRFAETIDAQGGRFAETVDAQGERLAAVSAQVTGSAVEVASLGEAFGAAVEQFGSASERLTGSLQRIEGALDKSMARSDEQLAYYVAQAREVVDLSILSQKQILDDLQQLAARPPVRVEQAATGATATADSEA